LVIGLDRNKFNPILVLPEKGPLFDVVTKFGVETYILKIAKLERATLSVNGLLRLPIDILKSIKGLDRILRIKNIDIVHSNTLAVLSGPLWAKLRRVPHIWHIHEMITSPWIAVKTYSYLLKYVTDYIVCNSIATLGQISDNTPAVKKKAIVIWNGISPPSNRLKGQGAQLRIRYGIEKKDVLVVLVGRINRWKGQTLLVEAAKLLKSTREPNERNLKYLIVGSSPPGQLFFKKKLVDLIVVTGMEADIRLLDFVPDIWPVWDACDIAVVPSIEPEPFGMVAIEAMAVGKPVLGADHGGLSEIIQHHKTGILFRPNCPRALSKAIHQLSADPEKRISYGRAGNLRQKKFFTTTHYVKTFDKFYTQILVK
jgi:glycosyltransferase involved in cell wall biosynthesis